MLFDKGVILFNASATDQTEALTKLASRLRQVEVVTDQFKNAILKREQNFPTGLQTATIGVAIPHTDADKVLVPQIGFMQLAKPVIFHQMGDNDEISVHMIFMLALKQADDQLKMLQTLMGLFQNEKAIEQLQTMSSKTDFIKLMKKIGIEK